MNIVEATSSYDSWLRRRTKVVERDLEKKHEAMAADPLSLLRATFYRFMQLWYERAGELLNATRVLAVGDLHVENFGTWRDSEGRLVWGINDFDEAYPLPFTLDLVRLGTSAHLAIAEKQLSVRVKESCEAILGGYVEGLESGGGPFVLAERNTWLWRLALDELRNPKQFWREQDAKCVTPLRKPTKDVVRIVEGMFPKGVTELRVLHRAAGKGSLGRQRFLFRGQWNGGIISREAKALVTSACAWAAEESSSRIYSGVILEQAVRATDPSAVLHGSWLIRRLAPDCSKIDLAHMPSGRDETKLLWAMGFETANIHLGTTGARKKIVKALHSMPKGWLHRASRAMADATRVDWKAWRARAR